MDEKKSRSAQILDRVFDLLDGVDLDKLSMNETKDFLEVVQRCQFLENSLRGPFLPGGVFGGSALEPRPDVSTEWP